MVGLEEQLLAVVLALLVKDMLAGLILHQQLPHIVLVVVEVLELLVETILAQTSVVMVE